MIVYATLNSQSKHENVRTTIADDVIHHNEVKFTEIETRQSKIINRLIKYSFMFITVGLIGFFLYVTIPSMYIGRNEVALLTPHGWISGIRNELSQQKTVYSFKGIPYALPPIGKLRFQPPVMFSEMGETKYLHRAHKFGPPCIQLNQNGDVIGDENCLFLNVFTPVLHGKYLLPVMVWIHGGDLMKGSGAENDFSKNPEFITSMNVVAVSMNYRLNAFGFLTLKELWDENKSYGNYGIMDQILVLKWIQNNIKNFGGDPNSVTIIGQGSGGTSVLALLASPLADGLFHKAISMSGSPKMDNNYKSAANHNRIFLQNTKCYHLPLKFIKQCLLNLTAQEIMDAIPFYNFPNWGNRDSFDIPKKDLLHDSLIVVDPVVVTESINNINRVKYFTKVKVPVILGTTAQEICLNPVYTFRNNSLIELNEFLRNRLSEFSPKLYKSAYKSYKKIIKSGISAQSLYEILSTDVRMTCPTNDIFEKLLQSKKHYAYRYVVVNHPTRPVAIGNRKLKCAFHSWDLITLFGHNNIPNFYPSETDIKYQQHIRELVKYFMVFGKIPHYSSHERIFKFTRYGFLQRNIQNYHHHQCKVWDSLRSYAWVN